MQIPPAGHGLASHSRAPRVSSAVTQLRARRALREDITKWQTRAHAASCDSTTKPCARVMRLGCDHAGLRAWRRPGHRPALRSPVLVRWRHRDRGQRPGRRSHREELATNLSVEGGPLCRVRRTRQTNSAVSWSGVSPSRSEEGLSDKELHPARRRPNARSQAAARRGRAEDAGLGPRRRRHHRAARRRRLGLRPDRRHRCRHQDRRRAQPLTTCPPPPGSATKWSKPPPEARIRGGRSGFPESAPRLRPGQIFTPQI